MIALRYGTPFERQAHRRRLTRLLIATLLACLLVLVWWGTAHGEERYTPSSRSARWENAAVERWRPLVAEYEWSVDTALRVIGCESGGDPTVPNRQGSGALGLFQIMPMHRWLTVQLFGQLLPFTNPAVNVAVAYELYLRFGGWVPWASSEGCWAW